MKKLKYYHNIKYITSNYNKFYDHLNRLIKIHTQNHIIIKVLIVLQFYKNHAFQCVILF